MMVHQLIWSVLLYFFVFCFPLHAMEGKSEIQLEHLFKHVNAQERGILEEFFGRLITQYHFGYVLFGNKPMATCGIAKHIDVLYLFSDDALSNQQIKKGWNVWKKQSQALEPDNFILRLAKNPLYPSMSMLVLINKTLVLDCVEKNITLFRQALGENINPDEVLFNLETKDSILQDALKNHEELFGILLGYGTHNSLMFVKTKPLNRYFSFASASDSSSVRLTPFNSYNPHLLFIDLPRFGADERDQETINLKNSYNKTCSELNNHCQKNSFLNTILTKWAAIPAGS